MRGLGREVTLLRMAQLVRQVELCLSVPHTEIKPGLAGTPRPALDDISNVSEEESLLTITEEDHGGVSHSKKQSSAMVGLNKIWNSMAWISDCWR